MYSYFAQFLPDPEQIGVYNVSFPDLPGCVTFGHGINGSMEAAIDALTGYLEVEMASGETISEASDYARAQAQAQKQSRELALDIPAETLYLLVPADPQPEPFVRVAISMQPPLLVQIDRRAKEEGLSRSGLLAAAAREYLARPIER